MREATSSSYSGIQFGHYIVASYNPILAEIDYQMALFPYISGYSPHRWQHDVDYMLLKKPGEYCITKLQVIFLFEADFNQNNKCLGRDAMGQAETLNLVAPSNTRTGRDL